MSKSLAIEDLDRVVGRLPANRLAPLRLEALERLKQAGVPTTRDEDWKYTDLGRIVEISNAWLGREPAPGPRSGATIDPVALTGIDGVDWLVFADGVVDPASLSALRATALDINLLSETDRTLAWEAPLADLNAALLVDGLHIRVPGNARPDRPLGFLLVDDAVDRVGVAQVRIEIDVEPGAEAELIEYHSSTGSEGHYANAFVRLALGDAAIASYVRIQRRARNHAQTARLEATLGRDSTFRHAAYDLGGALARNDLTIDIRGPGATAAFSGVYLASDDQHLDNHTRVDHRVGPAHSEQEYRGIATGSGRAVWNGKAIVHPGADGTDAQQANHNLLLSDRAEIDAKPELEIYADDVKCSHGATIGQLDSNALYYLQTRGIRRREAERLLTRAFAQSVVARNPVPSIREHVEALVDERLGSMLEETAA